jgi:poly(3-hydroxybutyrate) depolymerase
MNFIAEEQTCFVVYPAQRSDANQSKCWNWFAQLTSNAAEVGPRLSRASHAWSCATIRLIQNASKSADFGRSGRCGYHGSKLQRSRLRGRH